MKKLFALLLALTMVFSLATTAFAVEIKMDADNRTDDHTFDVYQIFTGDIKDGALSNLKYGANFGTEGNPVTDDELVEYGLLIKTGNETDGYTYTVATEAAARAFAEELKDADGTNDIKGTAIDTLDNTNDWTVNKIGEEDLPAGYYLIVDTSANLDEGVTKSAYILEVRDSATIKMKADKPESEKKVKDTNDSEANSTTDWQDSADYDIGDNVPFQITFTLPEDYATYDKYTVIVHDHQSNGLTFNGDVTVTIDGVEVEGWFDVKADPENTEKCGATACSFHISCADIKAKDLEDDSVDLKANSKIVFSYTSKLNENAQFGSTGNPNEMHIEFSNDPEGTGTNKTPNDKVIVFTYFLDVNKVNEKKEPLTGAGFTLYKFNDTTKAWVQIGNEINGEALTEFKWEGVDDGKYKLVETTTPAGYNTMADMEFEVTATHDEESDDPQLIKLQSAKMTTVNTESGSMNAGLETDVVNKAGTSLPETGGMGTTLFYIVGGFMVVAAAILLVTKKRMSVEG